jgi:hypothetical protein
MSPAARARSKSMRWAALLACLILAGCACKQPKPITPDPPVRVSRCHPLVEGVACAGAALNYSTMCSCVGDA